MDPCNDQVFTEIELDAVNRCVVFIVVDVVAGVVSPDGMLATAAGFAAGLSETGATFAAGLSREDAALDSATTAPAIGLVL